MPASRLPLRLFAVAVALGAAGLPRSARADDGLDVQAWLARPGVRLVAVELYATWCKPCMAAVPKWKALHDKYRGDGLRLIVVATQDPDGGCVNPGWNPDAIVCDDDGRLAGRFGAQQLPAAYLWTWQGELLSKGAHVEQVEAEIDKWIRASPRVEVRVDGVPRGVRVSKRQLRDKIRSELEKQDKLTVIATREEREKLDALLRRSHDQTGDERYACEIGMQITANSLLEGRIHGPKARRRLQLNLLSAESGCLVASAVVDWSRAKPDVSVAEGVETLMGRLKRRPRVPWAQGAAAHKPGQTATDYDALLARAEAAQRAAQKAKEAAAEARAARAARIERAWSALRRFATTSAIPKAERIGPLKKFLADFPVDNPHHADATSFIAALTAGREPGEVTAPGLVWVNSPPAKVAFTRTEVTVDQYAACVQSDACTTKGLQLDADGSKSKYCHWPARASRGEHPMNCVDWHQATAFCAWAGGRLPTTGEWFAEASDGGRRSYPWGDAESTCARAVIDDGHTTATAGDETDGCGRDLTWPVCSKPSGNSVSGLCDMVGNLWEWTSSADDKGRRLERGGSWMSNGQVYLRSSTQDQDGPEYRAEGVGFRCARP